MNINDAVTFLAGSILISVGLSMVGLMVLIMNNMFSKYWKPIKVFVYENRQYKLDEILNPTVDQEPVQKK